jgi:hypothetical protein
LGPDVRAWIERGREYIVDLTYRRQHTDRS